MKDLTVHIEESKSGNWIVDKKELKRINTIKNKTIDFLKTMSTGTLEAEINKLVESGLLIDGEYILEIARTKPESFWVEFYVLWNGGE